MKLEIKKFYALELDQEEKEILQDIVGNFNLKSVNQEISDLVELLYQKLNEVEK